MAMASKISRSQVTVEKICGCSGGWKVFIPAAWRLDSEELRGIYTQCFEGVEPDSLVPFPQSLMIEFPYWVDRKLVEEFIGVCFGVAEDKSNEATTAVTSK